ncbi:protein FAR1-RELATED SEQUENCE 5-like [Argentina anserina]|uniref:protein FAR1-RELATED SEQUENCE 5-like n=1 Tax=Argentina anserina TaxID=57926 RepID=UPI002176342B|nr:protein FAR1-RELATED SEQUENCE 5-like [Potentilla anserina]
MGKCNTQKKETNLELFGSDECGEDDENMGIPVFVGKTKRKGVARGTLYTRTGCKATFTVKLDQTTGQYHVFRFENIHNHGLAAVSEQHFLRSFKEVTTEDVLEVQALQAAGLGVSGSFDFLAKQSGGAPFLGFMIKDLYNKLDRYTRLNTELSDAEAAMNWLRLKRREEPKFFCRYNRDGDGRLSTLFWRDHPSFLDYEAFGDVLVIDSTYKTNIYGMPLVLFVGVNNHRASVVFACALVANEKEYTFNWVIERFLISMNNVVPVVTDGDERLHKELKVLGKLIYASDIIDEWEVIWDEMIAKHGLSQNEWLKSFHEKRERIAEAFFRLLNICVTGLVVFAKALYGSD